MCCSKSGLPGAVGGGGSREVVDFEFPETLGDGRQASTASVWRIDIRGSRVPAEDLGHDLPGESESSEAESELTLGDLGSVALADAGCSHGLYRTRELDDAAESLRQAHPPSRLDLNLLDVEGVSRDRRFTYQAYPDLPNVPTGRVSGSGPPRRIELQVAQEPAADRLGAVSSMRRSSALLLVAFLGLLAVAGALAVLASLGDASADGVPAGQAGPVDGEAFVRTAVVPAASDGRIDLHGAPPDLFRGTAADAREPRSGPRVPEPRVRGSDAPPIFLTCCSFLC